MGRDFFFIYSRPTSKTTMVNNIPNSVLQVLYFYEEPEVPVIKNNLGQFQFQFGFHMYKWNQKSGSRSGSWDPPQILVSVLIPLPKIRPSSKSRSLLELNGTGNSILQNIKSGSDFETVFKKQSQFQFDVYYFQTQNC